MAVEDYEKLGAFYLGKNYDLESRSLLEELTLYDSKDLTTHAVCVGMTGSGKTGLCLGLLEEAAIDGVPVIAIDPKGDLGNLMLTFPDLKPDNFRPWIDEDEAMRKGVTPDQFAKKSADLWKKGLADWEQDGERIAKFKDSVDIGIYTPGSNAGIPITVLRSFSAPTEAVLNDTDAFREKISSAVSGLLTLLGIDADPIRSREHILLSNIVSHFWQQGQDVTLPTLIRSIQAPPFDKIGFMDLDAVFPPDKRMTLSMSLNNLLASPGFAGWMQGEALNVERLLSTPEGKPRISIMSIAHLSDTERMFFVTILLNEILAWVRSQSGTSSLRAILYMDEVFGYFPPTANPPSKQPMLTLLKQARAFGLGVVLATQNPVDLDYKGLSNTGTWFIGRLQTERDKMRVLDGLEGASVNAGSEFNRKSMEATLSAVGKRVFLLHNVHEDHPVVFHTRWALSYLRGPLTRNHICDLMADKKAAMENAKPASPSVVSSSASEMTRPSAKTEQIEEQASPEAMRPIVPESIPERILAIQKPIGPSSKLIYRPGLIASGKLHYVESKSNIDRWRNYCRLIPINGSVPMDSWDSSEPLDISDLEFESEFEPGANYDDLPKELLKKTRYTQWKKELKSYLYREHDLQLWKYGSPKMYAQIDDSEAGFRMKIQQIIREERDLAIEKLHAKYASKIRTQEERVRKAEQKVDREQDQVSQVRTSSWVSIGTSMMGALFGRKLGSRTNVTGVGSAIRSSGRVSKEKEDVKRAEESLDAAQEKLLEMEDELKEDLAELEAPIRTEDIPIEDHILRPRKSDISVNEVSLAWLPWSVSKNGIAEPLYVTTD